MPNGDAARGGLGTVRNAVQLLELLAQGPAYHQLTDLAERSSMSIPTVHRLLRSLVLADLAVQDRATSRYGLGPELSRLSHHYLGRLPLLGALSPYLSQVRDQVGATVHVEVLVRGEVVYVDRVDSDASGPFRDSHRVHPALSTAGGRLLAARSDEDGWALALAAAGEEDRADAEASREEWRGAEWLAHRPSDRTVPAEVAVPVLDAAGAAVGALAADLTGTAGGTPDPAGRGGEERAAEVAAYLGRAAKAAGRTLGHG
ncbi:IclR family transcriptional regulator [Ornithinimicrobium cerasi]|uniref:IclR family transcriptional regulator n=1 Tax=Ornithinimicrobium cerasi TaxID=2248773 RepID=UPI000EFE2AC8|nr:helix-turn-helix domain-containing protein [Ornithinimicrobium cerasi]